MKIQRDIARMSGSLDEKIFCVCFVTESIFDKCIENITQALQALLLLSICTCVLRVG